MMLVVQPRFRLLNATSAPLAYRLAARTDVGGVLPAEQDTPAPLHWPHRLADRALQLSLSADAGWSGAVAVDAPAEYVLALPTADAPDGVLVRLTVEEAGPSLLLTASVCASAPYRVLNELPVHLTFEQSGGGRVRTVAPGGAADFAWDVPMGERTILLAPLVDTAPPEAPSTAAVAIIAAHRSGALSRVAVRPDRLGEPQPHGAPAADRKSTRLNSSHPSRTRMPSSA